MGIIVNRLSGILILAGLMVACGTDGKKSGGNAFGEACTDGSECASGLCADTPLNYCVQQCDEETPCPETASCSPTGYCILNAVANPGGMAAGGAAAGGSPTAGTPASGGAMGGDPNTDPTGGNTGGTPMTGGVPSTGGTPMNMGGMMTPPTGGAGAGDPL